MLLYPAGELVLREEAVAVLPREQFVPTTCDSCFKPLPGALLPVAPVVCLNSTLLYKLPGMPLRLCNSRCLRVGIDAATYSQALLCLTRLHGRYRDLQPTLRLDIRVLLRLNPSLHSSATCQPRPRNCAPPQELCGTT